MIRAGFFAAVLALAFSVPADAACERQTRTIVFGSHPAQITLAPKEFTQVVFPEPVIGFLPEKPEGLRSFGQDMGVSAERMFFTLTDEKYEGLALVHGKSGRTYHLSIVGRPSCADLTVNGEIATPKTHKPPSAVELSSGRKLLEYMAMGQEPDSYTRRKVPGTLPERLVFRQGSVSFFLSEVWEGQNYTGVVLLAVNKGRVPYRVGIEQIDFASPELREVLGRVTEVSMWPYDFRLAPSPEFAADAVHAQNQGLVFVVAENKQ